MPFAFSQLRPLNTGRVTSVDVPLGEYLSNAFSQGVHDSMFSSIMNMRELNIEREGELLSPDEANKRYSLGSLKFDTAVYESEARILRQRKEEEMRRSFYLSAGNPDGLLSKRGAAGLGASMLGSVLNPLDFSVNFLPVVGSEAAALRAAKFGRGAVVQSLERGLFTAESLGRLPAPRLVTSLVNAGVGNIVAEVPHLISAIESKEDYTVSESLVNVIAGTALGVAIHLGMSQAIRIYDRLNPDTKETMLKEAVNQFLQGKETDVTKYVEIDDSALREKVRFSEESVRAKAAQSLDLQSVKKAIYDKYHETPVKAAFKFTDGSVVTGSAHWLIDVEGIPAEKFNGMQEGFVTDKGTFVSREDAADAMGIGFEPSGERGELLSETMFSSKVISSDPELLSPVDRQIFDAVKEAGATDAEAIAEVQRIQQGRANELFFSRPDIQEKLEQEKQAAVNKIVEDEKSKYDEEGRYRIERDVEIQRQIAEGRVLTPEQKDTWNLSKKTVEEATAEVKDQIKELTEELKTELTPVSGEEDLKKVAKSEKSALEQAIDCLLKNPKI